MTIQGKVYTERKAAGEAIIKVCSKITDPDAKVDLGEYRGFPMQVTFDGDKFQVNLKQHLTYSAELSNEPVGNIVRINNALEKIAGDLQAHQNRRKRLENDMAAAKEEAARPFPKEEELLEKMERLTLLNRELESNPSRPEQENDGESAEMEETENFDNAPDGGEDWDDEAEKPDKAPPREPYRGVTETPRQSDRKPSIRDELRSYTPPARVASPPDRARPGVML